MGSEGSGPLLGSSGFVMPSLGNEEEEDRISSFQSLSVEGVTQLQTSNTQLTLFLWALTSDLSAQPALGAWLQGLRLCTQSLLTHLSVCLFYPLIASSGQSSSPWEIPSETHTKGGSRLCSHRYRGIQQTDSLGQGKLPLCLTSQARAQPQYSVVTPLCLDCGRRVT